MQPDLIPGEAADSAEAPAKRWSGWLRYAAMAALSLLLAWPIGYLVARRAAGYDVLANGRTQPVPTDSITELEAAVRENPSEANRIRLSWAYLRDNQAERAVPLLLSILASDKSSADAWNNLCVAHTMEMRYNLAVEDCTQALRIAPTYQLARNNLSWATGELQKNQNAISAQEQVAPSGRDAKFYLDEGLGFLHIGSYHQAILAWQRALQLDPRNALAANNIGVACMFLNQPAQAMTWFQRAISLDPAMQLARNNLAWARDELTKAAASSR